MDRPRATLYGWRQPRVAVAWLLGAATVCAGALVAYTVAEGAEDGAPLPALVVVVGLVLAAWGLSGWALALEVGFDGEHLAWKTLFGGGSVPVGEVRAVRASRLGPAVVVIVHAGGTVRVLSATRGLRELARAVTRRRPAVDVQLPGLFGVIDPKREG